MGSSEVLDLIEKSIDEKPKMKNNFFLPLIFQPFEWVQMLCNELNSSFIFGVFIVHGLNKGFAGSFFKVVTDFYWKDVRKVQPATAQLYIGLYYIPWVIKPLWGMLTDLFPVAGFRRRPYFIVSGVLGSLAALIVSIVDGIPISVALMCLIAIAAAISIADVTIDACVARNSIEKPELAPDMQSLCGVFSSIGSLLGYSVSGFCVHHFGPQEALGLLCLPTALLVLLGFVLYESRVNSTFEKAKAVERVREAVSGMWKTIKYPQVWKPSLFMFLALSLSISTHEGHFYWFTSSGGPHFSQEFVGLIYAIGALASIVGILIYHKFLKNVPFRSLIFFAQLLFFLSGTLDLTFVLRWNKVLKIPDSIFVIIEESSSHIISKIRWMPMIVLSTKLVPLGIEGTFFALLMCIDSLGFLTAKWGGGIILHFFGVSRNDFKHLWIVVLIRNLLRFTTIGLVFLVPKVNQSETLLPSDLFSRNSDIEEENVQLVSVHEKIEA